MSFSFTAKTAYIKWENIHLYIKLFVKLLGHSPLILVKNLHIDLYAKSGLDINFLRHLPCGQVPLGFHLPRLSFTCPAPLGVRLHLETEN